MDSAATLADAAAADACQTIKEAFPANSVFPGDEQYEQHRDKPWSPTCWLPAAGFVLPQNAQDVAKALAVVRRTGCKFAVRCSGHNQNCGLASVDGSGILIDVHDLKSLTLDDDGVLHAGAGTTWKEIYEFLDARGRSAVGGRHNDVGISGYTLGGGMPLFVNLNGFAADHLKSAELVLADSTTVTASADTKPDLLWALKGGGPNYGIVTRFDIQTYPKSEIWYTVKVFDPSDAENIIRASLEVQKSAENDPKIDFFVNFQPNFVAVGLFYAEWLENPEAFAPFFNLKSLMQDAVPPSKGTAKTLVDSIGLMNTVFRRYAACIVTKASEKVYLGVKELGHKCRAAHPRITNIVYTIQPVSHWAAAVGESREGNAMGVTKQSQCVWALVAEWNEASDDKEAMQAIDQLRDDIEILAKGSGDLLDWVFMNDASSKQKVLASYGEGNLSKLHTVAAKYDPSGLFQNQQYDGHLLRKCRQ